MKQQKNNQSAIFTLYLIKMIGPFADVKGLMIKEIETKSHNKTH